MTGKAAGLRLPLAMATALALAGCGTTQRGAAPPGPAAAPEEAGNWRGRERVTRAIAALNRGDSQAARRELMAVLRRDSGDVVARQLIQQIDTDPRQLLGRENYSYTLREGENLTTIAQRALGNPMLFYALARYNDIAVPSAVVPGQTILVPGRRPTPPPPRPEPRPTPPRPAPAPTPTPTPPSPPRPAPQATNPAAAARLRGQGLAALNGGAVNRAVALLRQALSLDPANAAIRADLNRALRIQSTLRSRR